MFILIWDYHMLNFLFRKFQKLEIVGDSRNVILGKNNYFHQDVTIDVSKGGIVSIGNMNSFFKGVMIMTYGGNIQIKNECSFNPYTILYGHGGLEIGNAVRVAAHTCIIPANHVFDSTDVPIKDQGLSKKGICIADNVWIGAGVKILDDVRIESGVVVAAGAVVTKNLHENAIYGGVPAKLISKR